MSDRREFSRKLKAEIVHRAMNEAGQVVCEGCGLILALKRYEIDHTLPEGLIVDKTRPLTAADGKLLGVACCHAPKTADDVRKIRKSDRQRDSHLGIRSASNPMEGSRKSRWRKPMNGPAVLR